MPAKKKAAAKNKKGAVAQEAFMTFRFTNQTAYWLILLMLVLAVAVWVLQMTVQTLDVYNNIQYLNASS